MSDNSVFHDLRNDGAAIFALNTGLTLRDYFAAAALQGWLASFPDHCVHPADPDHPNASRRDAMLSLHANCAYALADAMIAAREVRNG